MGEFEVEKEGKRLRMRRDSNLPFSSFGVRWGFFFFNLEKWPMERRKRVDWKRPLTKRLKKKKQ